MGIIIIDTSNTFDTIPIVDDTLPIYPGGPTVKLSVPCFLTTYEMAGALQEGAIHAMFLMKDQPPGLAAGKYIGFAVCERQESRRSMSPGISCVCECARACVRAGGRGMPPLQVSRKLVARRGCQLARTHTQTHSFTHTHARAHTRTRAHTHAHTDAPTCRRRSSQLTVGEDRVAAEHADALLGDFLSSRRSEREQEREALRQRLDPTSPSPAQRTHVFETSVSEAALTQLAASSPRQLAGAGANLLTAALNLVTPRQELDAAPATNADSADRYSHGGTAGSRLSLDVGAGVAERQAELGSDGANDPDLLGSNPATTATPLTSRGLAERAESVGQIINAALLLPEGTTIHPLITPRSPSIALPQSRGYGWKQAAADEVDNLAHVTRMGGSLGADVHTVCGAQGGVEHLGGGGGEDKQHRDGRRRRGIAGVA